MNNLFLKTVRGRKNDPIWPPIPPPLFNGNRRGRGVREEEINGCKIRLNQNKIGTQSVIDKRPIGSSDCLVLKMTKGQID